LKPKIIRASTIARSMDSFLSGQLSFLNNHFEIIAVSGEDEHLANIREREKIGTFSVPMQRQISPLKDFVAFIKLYRLFKREKPKIVHSFTPKAGLLCMCAAYFAKVPVRIHTFTGLIFPSKTGVMHFILSNLDRLLCAMATNIYPEGKGVKQELINHKITKKHLKVLANGSIKGIDIEYFNPDNFNELNNKNLRRELNIKEKDFVFVFIGRLVGDKGINELIAAFKKLLHEHAEVKLLLVGSFENYLDPLKPEAVRMIQEYPDIISLDYQEDVRPFYAIADALVFPSYREGFPNVVLEAGAMGLPCIVTDISGCNEIILNNENGIIIPIKDISSLLEAMKKFVLDKRYLQKLKANARSMVIKKFNKHLVWDAILKEYYLLSNSIN